MLNSENIFVEGIDTDTDPLLHSERRASDILNCRQADLEGRGYVNQLLNGNAFDVTQDLGFELTAGFVPFGKAVFQGVSFIMSFNTQTGEGEIGTYPSPKLGGAGGYDKVYRPLQNWIVANNPYLVAYTARTVNGYDWGSVGHLATLQPLRTNFKTTLFDWHCGLKLQVRARQDYDGSVNLYMCDWTHPNRVINCGFNVQTGAYTARTYFDKSFEQAINIFNETLWPIELFDTDEITCPVQIKDNGKFKCGNHHLYFRYADENFNYTSFVGHSEAVMIVPSDDNTNWAQTIQGGDSTVETNKSMRLKFRDNGFDQSYRYIQIAYVRNLEDGGFDVKLIDRHYEIQQLIATGYVVEINNMEDKLELTIADILKSKRRDDITRDLESQDSRLFFGNTKTDELYHPDLRDFALKVEPTILNDLTWSHPIQFNQCTIDQVAYKNYKNVYMFVGYFRKEWYPFNIQYLLDTGKWTDGFPIHGYDFYKGVANNLGLVRMPHAASSNPVDGAGNLKPIGVKFTIDGINLTPWMKQNVIGFRIVRGDRLENLMYQGLSTYCFNSIGKGGDDCAGSYGIQDNCTDIAEPTTLLYPKRWNVDKFMFWYGTTRIFPNFNLFQVENVSYGVPKRILDPGLDSVNGLIGNFAKRAIFPWIYTFKEKWCAAKLSPIWAGAKEHFLNGHIGNHIGHNPPQGIRLLGDDDGTFTSNADSAEGGGASGRDFRGLNASMPSWDYAKYGLFVPDFCMKKVFIDREYYIDDIADWKIDLTNLGTTDFIRLRVGDPNNAFGKNYNNTFQARSTNIRAFFWDTTKYTYRNNGYYRKGQVYGVQQWQIQANHQFSSYAAEGTGEDYNDESENSDTGDGSDDSNTGNFSLNLSKRAQNFTDLIFYYMHAHNRKDSKFYLTVQNSEFGMGAYLGIDFSQLPGNDQPFDWFYRILNVYRRDPETDTQENFISKNQTYHPIGHFIRLSDSFPLNMAGAPVAEPKVFNRYQGDCFLQRTYLKTLSNPKYNVEKKDDSFDGFIGAGSTLFSFGNIVGMITENATNVGVRHEDRLVEANQNKETFYPQLNPSDPLEYATKNKAHESYRYNSGYSKVMIHQVCAGYDNQMPYRSREFTTRIIFTNAHVIGELQDGWRMSELTNHRDFENSNGGIVRIISGKQKFYSIYENGIKIHFVNERAIKQGINEGDIVLGTQTDVISDKAINIDEQVGAQQMDAVDVSDTHIYGLHMPSRCIWSLQFGTTNVEYISLTKQANNLLTSMITQVVGDAHTDITTLYPDDAICNKGIVVMYDRSYNDVYFGICDNKQDLSTNMCLVFNEKQGRFFTRTDWCPPFYITINDDFYTVNPTIKQRFYKHDIEVFNGVPNICTFFGVVRPAEVEIIANKDSSLTKVFDAVRIIGNYISPASVEYRNEYQAGVHNPFDVDGVTPIYIKPMYRENAWRFSIKRCDTVQDSHYLPKSRFRSQHLRVRIKYLTNVQTYMKSIVTFFRPSKT